MFFNSHKSVSPVTQEKISKCPLHHERLQTGTQRETLHTPLNAAAGKTERGGKHAEQLKFSFPAGEKVNSYFGKLFDSI